jgi:hypothetical protein
MGKTMSLAFLVLADPDNCQKKMGCFKEPLDDVPGRT